LTDSALTAQGKGGVDHVLDEARPVGLHAFPGAEPYARASCSFLLRPAAPYPSDPDSLAELQSKFLGGLQHSSYMNFYMKYYNIIDHV
jgi:hypothetical protein